VRSLAFAAAVVCHSIVARVQQRRWLLWNQGAEQLLWLDQWTRAEVLAIERNQVEGVENRFGGVSAPP